MVQQLLQEQLIRSLKKGAEDRGQKPLQLLEGEPSLLAEIRRAFLHARHTG